MSDLIPFDYNGREFRGFNRDGEPWFVAADVCAVLAVQNVAQAVGQLDDDEVSTTYVTDRSGRQQEMYIVSEAGLYSLILRSRKKEAKVFKRWITHEVLPSIRKTGGYGTANVTKLPSRRELAQMVIEAEDRAALAESQVKQLEPVAKFAEDLASREGSWSVELAAKLLSNDPAIDTGRQRLFQKLNDWGWIYRRESRWTAKQEQINIGRLVHKVYDPRYDSDLGRVVDREPQVRITWKGLREIHRRLGGERPLRLDLGGAA